MRLSYLYDMFLYIQSAQTVSHSCKTSFTRAWIAHLCTTFQLWEGKQLDPPLQLYFNIVACLLSSWVSVCLFVFQNFWQLVKNIYKFSVVYRIIVPLWTLLYNYFIVSIKTKGSGTSYKAKKRECAQNPEF